MHFNFNGKTGHIETRGEFTSGKNASITTSNKINFTFWRDGNSLVMISDDTNQIPKILNPALEDTPDFFNTRERGLRLQIIRKNTSAYVLLYESTPTLYCTLVQ